MSIKAVTFYTVVCEECGTSADEGSDYAAWSDRDGAVESAHNADWWNSDDGDRWWCHDHAPVCPDCGELNEDGKHSVCDA